MVIKKTTWHPDTCGCGIEYDWDTDVADVDRVHTLNGVIETCPLHLGLTDQELFDVAQDENRRKNITFNIAKVSNVDLDTGDMQFSFTGSGKNRILVVTFTPGSLSPLDLVTVKAGADLQFGPGKVVAS